MARTEPGRGTTARSPSAPWPEIYDRLEAADPETLTPEDLDALSDAAWWLCRTDEAVAARQAAYAGHLAARADRPAAFAAWWLFYEHLYRGETAVALGWLRRMRRHLEEQPECPEHGYLAMAEAELAIFRGEAESAERRAAEGADIGHRLSDFDVAAECLQLQGRAMMSRGLIEQGWALLDEAMSLVLTGQVGEFFTGGVYCAVIAVCREYADLRRAGEWTEAAMSWCDTLPFATPFHGICRVHRGEVLGLLGAWDKAEAEALTACDELSRFRPGSAAVAHYAVGEIRRRRGDLAGAEESFLRSHQLGGDPQPGLALVRLAQGRADAAAAALRSALAHAAPDTVGRAQIRTAQLEVALAAHDLTTAKEATDDLSSIAAALPAPALEAMAWAAQGALRLARGELEAALVDLRKASICWRELGLPYEDAQTRLRIGQALRGLGDEEGSALEITAAVAILERLGAAGEAERARSLFAGRRSDPDRAAGLTDRELEVLRLVAAGKSNREIAGELVISEHTVARHLQNIFTKIGVSSRTAATAFAFEHGLL